MKFNFLVLALLFVSKLGFSQNDGSPDSKATNEKLNYFLEVTESLRQKGNNPGLAMAIIYDNKIIYKGGMGYRNRESKLPVTNQTVFALGSLSKAFTGVLAAQLVDEKLMGWDDPVRKHLKEFRLADEYATLHATIKDLFTHRIGLDQHYYLLYGPKYKRDEMLGVLPNLQLGSSLRENFLYNNMAYVVAGVAEERITAKSWEALMQERIYQPLNMKQSSCSSTDFLKASNKASSYKSDGKIRIIEDPMPASGGIDTYGPAGGVYSTIDDSSIWLQMLLNKGQHLGKRLLSEKQFNYITSPLTVRNAADAKFYGIGWDITMSKKYRTISHDGVTNGQRARILFVPELGFGVVIMSNQASLLTNILTLYAEEIFLYGNLKRNIEADAFIEEQAKNTEPLLPAAKHEITAPSILERLHEYEGTYKHPAYGTICIKRAGRNQLLFKYYDFKGTMKYNKLENFTAFTDHSTGKDTFALSFSTGSKGAINALEIAIPYSPLLVFKKYQNPAQGTSDAGLENGRSQP